MAIQQLNRDPSFLDFGIVAVDTVQSQTIEFNNQSSPSVSMDVTLATIAAPFSVGAGEDSFTLAANGDSKIVTVTYSPTATQVDDVTWTVTHTAPSPASPFNFTITAECAVPYTTYALDDIANNPAGTMKVDLVLESDVTTPTLPDGVKFLSIGPVVELIDSSPGIVDIQSMEIELMEDYATYSEGFWYHIIETDPTRQVSFRFILTEDGVDTFYFWGKVYREEVEWSELYVSTAGDSTIRTVKLRLVSLVHSLKDVGIETVITTMGLHESSVAGAWTVKGLITNILAAGFQQGYDLTHVTVSNTDVKFLQWDHTTEVAAVDAYIKGEDSAPITDRGYIDEPYSENNPLQWTVRYGSAYDLLRNICLNFGWICRYFFGQADGSYAGDATDRHRFELLTRGNAYATTVTPEQGIEDSTLFSDTVNKSANIKCSDPLTFNTTLGATVDQTTGWAWIHDGAEYPYVIPLRSTAAEYPAPAYPNPNWEFDLDFSAEFSVPACFLTAGALVQASGYNYRALFYNDGGTLKIITDVKYYDYRGGGWSETANLMQLALVRYYSRRFTSGRKMYERTYGSMKFTESGSTSHLNIKPMKRISINDGISADTYYATEIRKDFETNTCTVLWIQE